NSRKLYLISKAACYTLHLLKEYGFENPKFEFTKLLFSPLGKKFFENLEIKEYVSDLFAQKYDEEKKFLFMFDNSDKISWDKKFLDLFSTPSLNNRSNEMFVIATRVPKFPKYLGKTGSFNYRKMDYFIMPFK